MKKIIIISILITVSFSTVIAQNKSETKNKELGLGLFPLTKHGQVNLFYKKQLRENKYKRLKVETENLFYFNIDEDGGRVHIGGISFGREKRKLLYENLSFIRGWEFTNNFNATIDDSQFKIAYSPCLGLPLGFQYVIREKFALNIETTPRFNSSVEYGDLGIKVFSQLDYRLGYRNFTFTVLYKW